MEVINNRIKLLRNAMSAQGISACIIINSDPHLNEYIADHWKEREWLSGFDGSNGTLLITSGSMVLYTDSRYTLQAENQLKGLDVKIAVTTNTLSVLADYLNNELNQGKHQVALRMDVFSVNDIQQLKTDLNNNLTLINKDLITPLWTDRPSMPTNKAFLLGVEYAGLSASEKIAAIQTYLAAAGADILLLTALDDIAWTFNLRGSDISYHPLATAYAVASNEKAFLFINSQKTDTNVSLQLTEQGVTLHGYEQIAGFLKKASAGKTVMLSKNATNQFLYDSLDAHCQIIDCVSPATLLKCQKNKTEIEGIHNACVKDGIALVRFLMWLEEALDKEEITEMSLAGKLYNLRAEQPLFRGESFETIAGYKDNGAIVHYHANRHTNKQLEKNSFLLLDSGAQYLDGTTDITRTIALGAPDLQQKADFTNVLKGHIALATAVFPYGTCGYQLDVLARQFLWADGLNYGHGTGHGVGHFLNVHEGPQSIRPDASRIVLEEGMLITNEPGIYRAGQYGIRLENMLLVTGNEETEFGNFMKFETVTLCPFDKRSIEFSLLTEKEKNWLRDYHEQVYKKLSPFLTDEEKSWLLKSCEI